MWNVPKVTKVLKKNFLYYLKLSYTGETRIFREENSRDLSLGNIVYDVLEIDFHIESLYVLREKTEEFR